MAASFPLIGKHKHVQRHILSFLRPNELRIARYVFRDCPLPERTDAAEEHKYVKELFKNHAYDLLVLEIKKHGMYTNGIVLKTAFKTKAPAEIIILCVENMHAEIFSGDLEHLIAKFRRHDVLYGLSKRGYIWSRYQLCAGAWLFDDVKMLSFARQQMPADTDFIKHLWNAIDTELSSVPFSEGIIPVRVMEAILNGDLLDSTQHRFILVELLNTISSTQDIYFHINFFESRVLSICAALRHSIIQYRPERLEMYREEFEHENHNSLWDQVAIVIWP